MLNHHSDVQAGRRPLKRHTRIARRARILWRLRGRPEGRDVAIWLEAERRTLVQVGAAPRSIRMRLRDGYATPARHRSATSW